MALCCPHSTKPGLKKEARKPENTLAKRESVLLNIIALKNEAVNAFLEKDLPSLYRGIFSVVLPFSQLGGGIVSIVFSLKFHRDEFIVSLLAGRR